MNFVVDSNKNREEYLSEKTLEIIERQLDKITQGKWKLYYEEGEGCKVYGIHNDMYKEIIPAAVTEDSYCNDGREYGILNPDDAIFIVFAHKYMKELINEIKRLRNIAKS